LGLGLLDPACREGALRLGGRAVPDEADGSDYTRRERRADRSCPKSG
jgi:hypothetical protein